MTSNNYIGLAGWAKSGKDTVAEYLVKEQGYRRVSFADPMRQALLRLDPLIPMLNGHMRLSTAIRLMGWEDLKRENSEVRELLQRFGTEVGRQMFDQDFWVNLAIASIQPGEKIVFSDVRYKNEADAIRKLGGLVFKIVRDGVEPANSHSSEHDLADYEFDATIYNNGTIDALWNSLSSLTGYKTFSV